MLILTRKIGQDIIIDGKTVMTILEIDRGKIRIGIVAPPEVVVDRREVHERKQMEDGEK